MVHLCSGVRDKGMLLEVRSEQRAEFPLPVACQICLPSVEPTVCIRACKRMYALAVDQTIGVRTDTPPAL